MNLIQNWQMRRRAEGAGAGRAPINVNMIKNDENVNVVMSMAGAVTDGIDRMFAINVQMDGSDEQ